MTSDATEAAPPQRRLSRQQRHDQLLDVAEDLFIHRPYAEVSMEDIARGAQVSRPIVYRHFETKEGVYVACIRRIYESYNAVIAKVVDAVDGGPVDRLRAAGDLYFATLESDRGRWMLLAASSSVIAGEEADELRAVQLEHVAAIAALIRRGAPEVAVDLVEAQAHAISGVGEALGRWWLTRPDLDRQTVVDHYVRILVDGMAPLIPETTQA
ncbi:TetR/AcrR family transcriptional regulator [Gordonia crocea]|uniref:Putative transcriptional regulator, TetR family protein n=1 Tax=Gordonia crocea TaxID=589162 RepID=A0A7I9V1B9_9ACTN|nr:TetR/AcrR family transcriptional regulator [Gordonia crocea]GED98860.1 putative transcriptional regulator, TetR family protein [Gordonia crocea]